MKSSGEAVGVTPRPRTKTALALLAGLWLLTVLEALGMGAVGAAKFAGDSWLRMFEGWGFPTSFTYLIGGLEVAGALLLLVPRLASWGAVLLIVIMLGAAATLATTGYETQMGLSAPAIHLVVLTVLVRARWSARWRPEG